MIPEEHKHAVITSGIEFMRSITLAFGTESGMQLWDTISSTLDPSVKGDIFFAMLTGGIGSEITIHTAPVTIGKVTLIKIIREITGMGLKDAKDQVDILMPAGVWDPALQQTVMSNAAPQSIKIKISSANTRQTAMQTLRDVGCHVT